MSTTTPVTSSTAMDNERLHGRVIQTKTKTAYCIGEPSKSGKPGEHIINCFPKKNGATVPNQELMEAALVNAAKRGIQPGHVREVVTARQFSTGNNGRNLKNPTAEQLRADIGKKPAVPGGIMVYAQRPARSK